MIASICLTSLPSRSISFSLSLYFPIPGIILKIPDMEPNFCICFSCFKKSSKENSPFWIFLAPSLIVSWSIFLWACSIKDSKSPRSRILPAIRSGWKSSSPPSSFSLTPISLIGFPVTVLMESAAPPRASPSIFVKIVPSIPKLSSNARAVVTASCPVIESRTRRISWGWTSDLMFLSSSMSFSSMVRRPAVSRITTSLL